ncbi:MAG: ABC transporter substrate-binding protein [Gammaproteobacteria bacterium]|nr:ABC transporter substrate-binding protein [Gammaproteobacteria bacterium]
MSQLIKSKLNYLIVILFTFVTSIVMAETVTQVRFSGGAPLDAYQPRLIVPILTEAFKRNGIKFSAQYHPSLRSLKMSNSGEMDGQLHRVYNFHQVSAGKYPNLVRVESKLLTVSVAVFAKKNIKIKNWDDLKGYTAIYYRGRKNVESQLKRVLPVDKIGQATTDKQAFRVLSVGRADVVISESTQGNKIIAANPKLAGIIEVVKLEETEIYAYMHKKHKVLALKIAKTIDKMKQDGTFYKIIDQVNRNSFNDDN